MQQSSNSPPTPHHNAHAHRTLPKQAHPPTETTHHYESQPRTSYTHTRHTSSNSTAPSSAHSTHSHSHPLNTPLVVLSTSVTKPHPAYAHRHFARHAASRIIERSRKPLVSSRALPLPEVPITSPINTDSTPPVFTIVSTSSLCSHPSTPTSSCCSKDRSPKTECMGLRSPSLITRSKVALARFAINASILDCSNARFCSASLSRMLCDSSSTAACETATATWSVTASTIPTSCGPHDLLAKPSSPPLGTRRAPEPLRPSSPRARPGRRRESRMTTSSRTSARAPCG
ncbi:P-loop containing nucleoside triphosphatehydrolases superfamily protein [Striga asiatica]|uniref:P-loop containing nucleoside triphosphatehydrolases superfamily protein n=1 Tax=Striga asiatica TaxID=4170 RepID=A0A5A7RID9_STRAF|nr:P-loop containing nucleoside triphosphatehydrolases superfamily protein [Striga asiatica]